MQRKVLFLIGFVVLIIFVFILIRFVILNRAPRQGMLKVTSNVSARVLLDNRDIGKTPLEQKMVTGDYTIRLVPETTDQTMSSWQGRVTINPNTLTYINRDLSQSELTSAGEQLWIEKIAGNTAELSVISVPDGANVILNDQPRGVTPISLTDLPQGDHTLVVSSPGFEPRTVKIKLTSGYRVISSLALALSPSQIASPPSLTAKDASQSALLSTTEKKLVASPTVTPTVASATPVPSTTKSPTPTKIPTPTQKAVAGVPTKVRITETPTGFLRVRKEPSTAAEEIGRAKPGEEYDVTGQQSTWYKIDFNGTPGWISSQYAEKVE